MHGERNIYTGFWVSVLLKGLISVAEMLAGIIIFFVPLDLITDIILSIANSGYVGGVHGFVTTQLLKIVAEFTTGTQIFVAIYLFSRGLVKTGLVLALLKNKLWAYPASLVVLGLFVLYQIYQIITTHSFVLILITLFDLVVMYFIWREYKVVRAHQGVRPEHFSEVPTGTE